MIYINGTTEFYIEEPTVLSLGKFDGLHRGHELLMERLSRKKSEGLKSVVFTFDMPPIPDALPEERKVLTTNDEKRQLFEDIGVDYLIECPFTQEIRNMEPEKFIAWIVKKLHVSCIVVGEDFCFGHLRRGNYKMLQKYANEYSYEIMVIPKMQEDHRDISSTYIREEIAQGNIEKANHLLGYRYFVTGVIEHGNQIGRTIGIPTINLFAPEEKLLPPCGVYVSEVLLENSVYRGITNVGRKPTISGNNPIGIETHLLDFNSDVYGKKATIEFLTHVRPEMKFENIPALQQQMENDIAYGRNYFFTKQD